MLISVCLAKIHRANVTEADLNYVGSITIGKEMLDAAGILPGQMLTINNVSNGISWRTYALPGKAKEICLNGPPARHFQPKDKVIILAEAWVEREEGKNYLPKVVFVDENNNITEVKEGGQH